MRRALEHYGHEVATAGDGAAAGPGSVGQDVLAAYLRYHHTGDR